MRRETLIIGLYAVIGFLLTLGGLIVSSNSNVGYYGNNITLQILGIIIGFSSFFIGFHLLIVSIISLINLKK